MKKVGLIILLSSFAVADVTAGHPWQKVDLREVKVRGEIGRRIDMAVYGNMMKMEIEKQFLDHFREKTRKADSVGTGKLIEYAVRFAAYTRDPKVKALKEHIVAELLKTQGADGYIGCLCPEARLWGYWDLAETGFILLGLTADYRYFGEKRSLDAAVRAADYVLANWHTMPEGWETAWISGTAAALGLCWGMEALYRETGDARYLDFCRTKRNLDTWYAPVVTGRGFGIHGHSATHLYQCLVQLDFADRPTSALRRAADETAAFMLDGDGTLVTGACGLWECWGCDQAGRLAAGETCSTTLQIRFWDMLIQCAEHPDARWGDALERTVYNALFAAQSEDGRKVRYFVPIEGPRVYYPGDTFCCPNNFRRLVSELPEYLFYRSGDMLFANLYSDCDLETKLSDGTPVRVKERTGYPTDEKIVFSLDVDDPHQFGLAFRIPGWCENPSLVVCGERIDVKPGTIAKVCRTWSRGATVTLTLPMRVRTVAGRKRQSGRAAFVRGPLVYSLNPTLNRTREETLKADEDLSVAAGQLRAEKLQGLMSRDAADYATEMMVDPSTARLVSDDTVRPGGTAVEVRACTAGHAVGTSGLYGCTIRLTEHPDVNATATYFRLLGDAPAEADGLFTGDRPPKTCRQHDLTSKTSLMK